MTADDLEALLDEDDPKAAIVQKIISIEVTDEEFRDDEPAAAGTAAHIAAHRTQPRTESRRAYSCRGCRLQAKSKLRRRPRPMQTRTRWSWRPFTRCRSAC